MANYLMWYQGNQGQEFPNCDGYRFVPPVSTKIASEYQREKFFLSNVINNHYFDEIGIDTNRKKSLETIVANDVLWLLAIPPTHFVEDAIMYAEETWAEGSDLDSLAGAKLTLVQGKFTKENGTPSDIQELGSITYTKGNRVKQVAHKAINYLTKPTEWLGIGIKVATLPTVNRGLADVTAKIAVGCHVKAYDTQTHM